MTATRYVIVMSLVLALQPHLFSMENVIKDRVSQTLTVILPPDQDLVIFLKGAPLPAYIERVVQERIVSDVLDVSGAKCAVLVVLLSEPLSVRLDSAGYFPGTKGIVLQESYRLDKQVIPQVTRLLFFVRHGPVDKGAASAPSPTPP